MGWYFNVALVVHGDAIVEGTLDATKLVANTLTVGNLETNLLTTTTPNYDVFRRGDTALPYTSFTSSSNSVGYRKTGDSAWIIGTVSDLVTAAFGKSTSFSVGDTVPYTQYTDDGTSLAGGVIAHGASMVCEEFNSSPGNNTKWDLDRAVTINGNAVVEGTLTTKSLISQNDDYGFALNLNGSSSSIIHMSTSPNGGWAGASGLRISLDQSLNTFTNPGIAMDSYSSSTASVATFQDNHAVDASTISLSSTASGWLGALSAGDSYGYVLKLLQKKVNGTYVAPGKFGNFISSVTSPFVVTKAMAALGGLSIFSGMYLEGVAYPFTAGHTGTLRGSPTPDIGDILIDTGHIVKALDISNIITEVELSSTPNQKTVIGIFNGAYHDRSLATSTVVADSEYLKDDIDMNTILKTSSETPSEPSVGTYGFNSIGEGQMFVCSLGGDFEAGDLITTSTFPGKGQRQNMADGSADDLIRNYTAGKIREPVVWADEVVGENGCMENSSGTKYRLVACIYHCG